MSFTFQNINSSKPIFEEPPIQSSDIPITDSLYLQNINDKLKELDHKIRYFEVHHPQHKDIMKMKLVRKKITNEIFKKNKLYK